MRDSSQGRLLHLAQWFVDTFSLSVKSIRKQIGAIRQHIARTHGFQYPYPPAYDPYLLRVEQYEAVSTDADGKPKQLGVTSELVRNVLDDSSAQWGTALCVLCMFTALLRSSEACAPYAGPLTELQKQSVLLRSDVSFDPITGSYIFRIKASKTDPAFRGPQCQWMPTGTEHCPVKLLTAYLCWFDANFEPDTPLFRKDDGSNVLRANVSALIKWHAQLLGYDPAQFGSHSARRGGASALFAAGHGSEIVSMAGRWSLNYLPVMAMSYGGESVAQAQLIADALNVDTAVPAQFFGKRH